MVASKYSLCDIEINTQQVKLCSMFGHSPNGKDIVYGSSGIYFQTPMDYYLRVYSPNGKGSFYERLFFEW